VRVLRECTILLVFLFLDRRVSEEKNWKFLLGWQFLILEKVGTALSAIGQSINTVIAIRELQKQ
jgi:hypothetical protein